MPQVSIIVATYNPDPIKLRKTLEAAVVQQGVDVEIIISDDGSSQKDFTFIPEFFSVHGFTQYQILEHPENRGTVYNCYAGVCAANGEYIFTTSPGDFLFDETTMQQFYKFAEQRQAQLCFGNAVRYAVVDGTVIRTSPYSIPATPDAYGAESSLYRQKMSFFGDNLISGACYFRSRSFAKKYLGQLLGVAKYMEDTPSTMSALLDGIRINYFDRNIIFYEDGTGISTGGNDKWRVLLHQDLVNVLEELRKHHSKNPYLKISWKNATETSRWKRIAYRFIAHPILSVSMLIERKLRKPRKIYCSDDDWSRLSRLVLENSDN